MNLDKFLILFININYPCWKIRAAFAKPHKAEAPSEWPMLDLRQPTNIGRDLFGRNALTNLK